MKIKVLEAGVPFWTIVGENPIQSHVVEVLDLCLLAGELS